MGRKNLADDAPIDDPLFEAAAWQAIPAKHRDALRQKARAQLGTVGSGNHYVDLFADEAGMLWVGVHFGSRGFGHTIASNFLALSQGLEWGARAPEVEVLLDLSTPLGDAYWTLMSLAGEYAYAGREWVARKVVAMLGAQEVELVHNHHNFAWKEDARGRGVRGGAEGGHAGISGAARLHRWVDGRQRGDRAGGVAGAAARRGGPARSGALLDRARGGARDVADCGGRQDPSQVGAVLREGAISQEMMHGWLAECGVVLRGGGLDEAPQAYRRLPRVLAAQRGTIEVLHTLRPLVVVMAGANEYDPYRD